MGDINLLAERFEANRTHLRSAAYRMLGSLSEAEDAVQESWLRLRRSDTSSVHNLGEWLTTSSRGCASTCCAREHRGARSPLARTGPSPSPAVRTEPP
jgi:DNA-directed RNA polymerase specialized sigma24 family protein